jgi:hypothetical protein
MKDAPKGILGQPPRAALRHFIHEPKHMTFYGRLSTAAVPDDAQTR